MDEPTGKKAHIQEPMGLPQGYRAGLVTAVTLFLGFSITFLRFWSFEAPGTWTPASIGSSILISVGILIQLIALFRALDIRDEIPVRYRATVRWFFLGVVIVIVGAVLSSIVFAVENG